jgi:elongation factor Ts
MAEIKSTDVKKLRDATGAGMMDCKKALVDAEGDIEKAKDLLRERGLAGAKKFASRGADEGVVEAYLHKPDPGMPAKLGVLVELNCATDFVAKTERFQKLAREVAQHISFARPEYVSRENFPGDVLEREKEIYRKQAEGKPEHVVDKMVEGKLNSFFAATPGGALLDQLYIRDDKKTIGQLLDEASAELKEPVRVRRFACFKVGEE